MQVRYQAAPHSDRGGDSITGRLKEVLSLRTSVRVGLAILSAGAWSPQIPGKGNIGHCPLNHGQPEQRFHHEFRGPAPRRAGSALAPTATADELEEQQRAP